MKACKITGAQAVHLGYGFLSEKARFVDTLKKNKITFIGPRFESINAMGDKIESKKVSVTYFFLFFYFFVAHRLFSQTTPENQLAASLGVNTIPGFKGIVEDVEHALRICTTSFISLMYFFIGSE